VPDVSSVRLPFSFDPRFVVPAAAFGVTPVTTSVTVDADRVVVRFGPWRMAVDRDNIAGVEVSGPYQLWKVLGPPRLSLADRGITFATNADRGVCLRLHRPVSGIEPTGTFRHPGLTVTVADPPALAALLSV
jgi:hypothetical protein